MGHIIFYPVRAAQILRVDLLQLHKQGKHQVLKRRTADIQVGDFENTHNSRCIICGKDLQGLAFGYLVREISSSLPEPATLYTFRACESHRDELAQRILSVISLLSDPEFLTQNQGKLSFHRTGQLNHLIERHHIEIKHWGVHSLRILLEALAYQKLIVPDRDGGILARIQIRWKGQTPTDSHWQRWLLEISRAKDGSEEAFCNICEQEISPDQIYGFRVWQLGPLNSSPASLVWEFLTCPHHQHESRKQLWHALQILQSVPFLKEHKGHLFGARQDPFPYLKVMHEGAAPFEVVAAALERAGVQVIRGFEQFERQPLTPPTPNFGEIAKTMNDYLRAAHMDAVIKADTADRKRIGLPPVNASIDQIVSGLGNIFMEAGIEWFVISATESFLVISVEGTEFVVVSNRATMRTYARIYPEDTRPVIWFSGGKFQTLKKVQDHLNAIQRKEGLYASNNGGVLRDVS